MKLLPLLLFACMAVAAHGDEPQSVGKDLKAYVGKDLRKLKGDALSRFWERVQIATGDKLDKRDKFARFEAWWVKKFSSGNAAWVFVEAYPGYDVPDVSAVRVHVFDKDWKRLFEQSFPTGYRFFLQEVTIVSHKSLSQDLLVAKATNSGPFIVREKDKKPAFEQGNFQRQHYALLGNRLAMVRLEDDTGRLARNHYRWSTPVKGPPAPKRTKDHWVRSLRSDDPIEQLETLAWLTGIHLSSTEPRSKNMNQESVADSKLFESVRDDPETSKALRMLKNSKHKWVQEYTALGIAPG